MDNTDALSRSRCRERRLNNERTLQQTLLPKRIRIFPNPQQNDLLQNIFATIDTLRQINGSNTR